MTQPESTPGPESADSGQRPDGGQNTLNRPKIHKYHDKASGEDVEVMVSTDKSGRETSRRTTRTRIDHQANRRYCLVTYQRNDREVRRRESVDTTLDPVDNYYEGLTSCSVGGQLIWVNQSSFDPRFEGDPNRSRATFKRWAINEGSTYEVKTRETDPETLTMSYSTRRQTIDFETGAWQLETTNSKFELTGNQTDRTVWEMNPRNAQPTGLMIREVNGKEVWRRNLVADPTNPRKDEDDNQPR